VFTAANNYARSSNDLVFQNSTFIDEDNNFVATGGQGQNGFYHMYQTHNVIGVDNCLATAIPGDFYDPEFIVEDILMETSDLEAVFGDLEYVMNEINDDLNLVCSETLSNETLPDQNEVRLFPNPCQNSFQIDGLEEQTPLRILNILGEELLSTNYKSGKINMSDLPDGMYLIEVDGRQTFRLIKQ